MQALRLLLAVLVLHDRQRHAQQRLQRGTYAGRFGAALGGGTNLSGTLRRVDGEFGSANAFVSIGIADDSTQDSDLTYATIAADSQLTDVAEHGALRVGDQTIDYVNPTPSGTPFDPFGFGANYLGQHGDAARRQRRDGHRPRDPRLRRHLSAHVRQPHHAPHALGSDDVPGRPDAGDLGRRRATSTKQGFDDPDERSVGTRNNGGAFVEARASLANRAYVSGGVGVEHNEVFGTEAVRRASRWRSICGNRPLASWARRKSA